jgi:hypothetical protein
MVQRNGLRLLVEMAVIVATAAVTGFAHLGAWTIVGSVVVVWLGISAFEYLRSHLRTAGRANRPFGMRSQAIAGPPADPLPPPSMAFERVRVLTGRPAAGSAVEQVPAAPVDEDAVASPAAAQEAAPEQSAQRELYEPEPAFEADLSFEGVRVLPAPTRELQDELAPHVPVPELERRVEAAAMSEPQPRAGDPPAGQSPVIPPERLDAAPPERMEPLVPAEPAEPWPMQEHPVADVDGDGRPVAEPQPGQVPVTVAAWSWNVWNLERVVRERASTNDELNFLLLYLRDYANPAGMLPPDFDALVRESFGDLLAAPA